MDSLHRTIEKSIRSRHLISSGDHVLIAVSGGSDSMALLDLLATLAPGLSISITAAYLDHGIRPKRETKQDLKVILSLCKTHGIPLRTGRVDVPALAKKTKMSIETAAREARHRFLSASARKANATCIATAHTQNDQAETLLMRMLRGTGPDGLAGILPSSIWDGVRLIRPVLHCSKAELREHLKRNKIAWNEDSTNSDDAHFRNKIRRKLMPLIEHMASPGVSERLSKLATLMADDAEWLEGLVAKETKSVRDPKDGSLRVAKLTEKPLALQRRIVRSWLGGVSDDMATVERVLSSVGSKKEAERENAVGSLQLRGGWVVQKVGGRLVLRPDGGLRRGLPTTNARKVGRPLRGLRLNVPGLTHLPALNLHITARFATGILRPKLQRPGQWPAICSLSAKACKGRKLMIRTWKPGDRIKPLGFNGTKKVQDVFTDLRVPKEERERIPLLVCGTEIVWIPGYHVAKGWEVEGETAKAVEVRIESAGGIRVVESSGIGGDDAPPSKRKRKLQ